VYTPNVYLIDLNIDGTIEKAMIQDLQWHPVEEMLMHVDFLRVIDNKPLTINIPVKVTGMAKGVKAGGRLKINMRLLRIKALPENLPDNIEIDITQLAIGDSIKVNEVKRDNLEFLDNKSNLIVGVVSTRISQSDIDLLEEEEEEQEESGEDTAEDQLQS
ncbi:MAG: 50S ribosomal protein L25, partial [Bacteroidales bacterium]|nr:50S ribosomal protein L25 [Bacteroidales bacterium]